MGFFASLRRSRAVRKANRLARRGRPDSALAILEEAQSEAPQNVDLHIQRAWVLCDLRRHADAVAVTESALALSPGNGVLQMLKGEALYGLGDYPAARDAFLKALEFSGENLRVEYGLGLTMVALGDMEAASRYFESSVRYDKALVESRLLAMAERYLFERRNKLC